VPLPCFSCRNVFAVSTDHFLFPYES
jgi:hypothetical protein